MSEYTIEVRFVAWQSWTENGDSEWVGAALLGNELVVTTDMGDTPRRAPDLNTALAYAERAFYRALSCSHQTKYSHDETGRDFMGNEYDARVDYCKICGYRKTTETGDGDF